jgi:hypothetical protein
MEGQKETTRNGIQESRQAMHLSNKLRSVTATLTRWLSNRSHQPVYLSIYLSIYLSTYLPTYLSTYISVYLPTYLPICLSIYIRLAVPCHALLWPFPVTD